MKEIELYLYKWNNCINVKTRNFYVYGILHEK